MEYYLSEILIMANTYAPDGTIAANGTTLTINQYNALFALLGITYGGNGTTNFMIPDLCGRVPIGSGLSLRDRIFDYTQGQYGGAATTTLSENTLPAHTHPATFTPTYTDATPVTVAIGVSTDTSNNVPNPKNNVIGKGVDGNGVGLKNFSSGGATAGAYLGGVTVSGGGGGITGGVVTVGIAGSSIPVGLMQPYVAINYCLVTSGIYPSRP